MKIIARLSFHDPNTSRLLDDNVNSRLIDGNDERTNVTYKIIAVDLMLSRINEKIPINFKPGATSNNYVNVKQRPHSGPRNS
jgi:hypothetical protein